VQHTEEEANGESFVQTKVEELLKERAEKLVQKRLREFESKGSEQAERIARDWRQEGKTLDEIIEEQFKEYEAQFGGIYSKALALKRMFEESKRTIEQKVVLQCIHRDLPIIRR
jgi:hypothetical protein